MARTIPPHTRSQVASSSFSRLVRSDACATCSMHDPGLPRGKNARPSRSLTGFVMSLVHAQFVPSLRNAESKLR